MASKARTQNPRAYQDALQAMCADMRKEAVAGSILFVQLMETDPKTCRKHLKTLPHDLLVDCVASLAKHLIAPATSPRQARTVPVGIAAGPGARVPPPAGAPVAAGPKVAASGPAAVPKKAESGLVVTASQARAALDLEKEKKPPALHVEKSVDEGTFGYFSFVCSSLS